MPSLYRCSFDEFPKNANRVQEGVADDGAALISNCVQEPTLEELRDQIRKLPTRSTRRSRAGTSYATRKLLDSERFRALSAEPPFALLVSLVLGPQARPIRGLLFDKSPDANWKVPWHQDLSIAVAERVDIPEYGPWSKKGGVVHTHAPVSVLEKCLAIRLHLDHSNEQRGALQIIPQSHRLGKLLPEYICTATQNRTAIWCTAAPGDILLMHPLVLHRSSPATHPTRRRTIHFEYSSATLPQGLSWAYSRATPSAK